MALIVSCFTPAFNAEGSCALYSYCCVHCLAVNRMTNSVSFGPILLWKRTYSPVFCSTLMNSGLRSSGTKGPSAPPAPRGPEVTSSKAFFCASVIFSFGIGGHHFILGFTLRHQLRHAIADGHDHVPVRHDLSSTNHRAVSRNDLRVRARSPNEQAKPVDHAIEAAAIRAVDIWVLNRTVEVAAHDHIGAGEIDESVAIRMSARNPNQPYILAVHVKCKAPFVSNK